MLPKVNPYSKSSPIWTDICQVGSQGYCISNIVREGFKIKINSQNITRFWEHAWVGASSLEAEFRRLFLLSTQKDDSVQQIWNNGSLPRWNLQFRKPLFIWEEEFVEALREKLWDISIVSNSDDVMQWDWSSNKSFTVRSAYSSWEGSVFSLNKNLLQVWRNVCPPQVEFLIWQTAQEAILTRSNLARRGILNQPQPLLCPLGFV